MVIIGIVDEQIIEDKYNQRYDLKQTFILIAQE